MTGEKVLGVGDASGMFPIDMNTKDYDEEMIQKFDKLIEGENYPWKIKEILPKVLVAGDAAGILTEEGAKKLDPTGNLEAGIPLSSGRRCRNRYGSYKQRSTAYKQHFRWYFILFYGCP